MKRLMCKLLRSVAMAAFTIALTAGGTASFGGLHQMKEPKELKKYNK